jgi:putative ABC transport system substrate-binding protein
VDAAVCLSRTGAERLTRYSRAAALNLSPIRHGIPAIFTSREFAETGGLMSYGANLKEVYPLVGVYTGRILKGEHPADLPVVQPMKLSSSSIS